MKDSVDNIKILKRDGRETDFNRNNIEVAIRKSIVSVDGEVSEESEKLVQETTDSVVSKIKKNPKKIYSVEEVQDMVEKKLMVTSRKDVARAYITFRNERTRVRERNSKLREILKEKLFAKNVQNQNANLDENSFGGRRGEADSVILKSLALDECMSDVSRENHINNEIYIHDLDSYIIGMHNCLTLPMSRLLQQGFNTRQTDIRPAGSISTAMQLVAVLFQIQSLQQFGGVSAGSIDYTMVPFVRKSFFKHYKKGMKYLLTKRDYRKIKRWYRKMSKRNK